MKHPALASGRESGAGTPIDFSLAAFSSCADDVLVFRNANRGVSRAQSYLAWRYHRPCAQEPQIVWVHDREGRPVGAASLVPHDYFVLDGLYPVGLLGDISVLPAYRGQGIAGQMLQFLAGHSALRALRACIVLPNDEAERPLVRAGWRKVTALHRFVKLLDVQPLLQRKFGPGRAARVLAAGMNAVLGAIHFREWFSRRSGHEVKVTDAFDARYDALWGEAAYSGRIMAVRNSAYLNWRFVQHPIISHQVFEIARAGKLEGYLVFHRDGDRLAVDDYFAIRPGAVTSLLAAFLAWVRADRLAATVQIPCNGSDLFPVPWAQFGFSRRKDSQAVMLLDTQSAEASPLLQAEKFHVTAGDKDV